MFKFCRKAIFPRWPLNRQSPVENKSKGATCRQASVLLPSCYKKRYSDENYEGKQHADRQEKRFWKDAQFHFHFFRSSILETAGFLGTAAVLCLDIHLKQIKSIYEHDSRGNHCFLYRHVLAMPQHVKKKDSLLLNPPVTSSSVPISGETNSAKVSCDADLIENITRLTAQYAAAVQNSTGLSCLGKSNKKAFRNFQAAARLGSSQAFYNLGLCYELGKGTRVNLNRAAFCYRKAAMKGHGLAAFNLAVYFQKGLGGLPVDPQIAKLLLAEAANKGVPEAQLYIGLECLEEEKYSEAFEIFNNLAKQDVSDGKYYLALCYENGWGIQKNEKVAVEIFSQCAILGHAKATLKLGSYYEEGRGSCDCDYGFAGALYQILSDQGDVMGGKALAKLKLKREGKSVNTELTKDLPLKKTDRTILHVSASVPALVSEENTLIQDRCAPFIPPYLNIITPFPSFKTNESQDMQRKTMFYVGENNPSINFSNTFVPLLQNMPQVVEAKT